MKFWSEFLPITLFGFGLGSAATSIFYQTSAIWKRIMSPSQPQREIYIITTADIAAKVREEIARQDSLQTQNEKTEGE